jgi:hypothetical protein
MKPSWRRSGSTRSHTAGHALAQADVEGPFATLKAWIGATHFLTKTLPRVRTEMSLHILAYNLKRAMPIFGVQTLMRAMVA